MQDHSMNTTDAARHAGEMIPCVVDIGCMDQVLRGLYARDSRGQLVPEFDGQFTLDVQHSALWADPTRVGRKLYAMNVEAVMQRYPDCRTTPGKLPGPDQAHRLPVTYRAPRERLTVCRDPNTLIGCYKAVETLLHHCSEGHIPGSKLFTGLERAASRLATAIVRSLPAYEMAPW